MRLAQILALAALSLVAQTAFGQRSLLSQVEQGLQPPGGTASPAAGAAQETGYLGFIPDETNVQVRGVRVESVKAGAPAAQGGLKDGDLIVSIDGKPITGLPQLDVILDQTRPNQRLQITVERNGQPTTLNVTAGNKPPPPRDDQPAAAATPGAPGPAPGAFPSLTPPGGAGTPGALPSTDTTPRPSGIVAQPQNPVPPAGETPGSTSGAASGGASLGVTLPPPGPGTSNRAVRGALIAGIKAGSPAALAGLKAGQTIVQIDGRPIDTDDDLIAAIRARQPGQSVELSYRDGNEVRKTTARLAQAGAAAAPSTGGGFSAPGGGFSAPGGGFSAPGGAAPGAGGGLGGVSPPGSAAPPSGSPFRFGPGGGSRALLDQIERGDNLARPASTVYDPLAFAALLRRVEELEERIKTLEGKVGGNSSATPGLGGTSTTPGLTTPGFATTPPPVTPGFGPSLGGGTGTTP